MFNAFNVVKFISKFHYKNTGFFLQVDYLNSAIVGGLRKHYIRKAYLIFDFGKYTKYWRILDRSIIRLK